jgi:DNA processing protein
MPPLPFEELKALVLLNRLIVGGGPVVRTLLLEGIAPSEIIRRIFSENLLAKAETLKNLLTSFDPEREIELADKKGVRFLTLFDPDYPYLLKQIFDPPILLYRYGSLLESDQASLAIVGSRHPSFYGLTQARQLSQELARAGLTILSGLARGIDLAAHEAAFEIPYGRSVAVMGCGIDYVYPPESRKVYAELMERGAILSEYAFRTPPFAENFPRRNRIISGLSLGVLVVEAHSRSGSLITAHQAAEQGREVFALPGPVDQLTSRGTHRLLKEGAVLVESAQDILEVLAPSLKTFVPTLHFETQSVPGRFQRNADPTQPMPDFEAISQEEQKVLGALAKGPLVFDEIVSACSFSSGSAASLLLHLELKKKIYKKRDARFELTKA